MRKVPFPGIMIKRVTVSIFTMAERRKTIEGGNLLSIVEKGMEERTRNRLKMILDIAKEWVLYVILIYALWCMAKQHASLEHTAELLGFLVGFWLTWRFTAFLTSKLQNSYWKWLILGAGWAIDWLLAALSEGLSVWEFLNLVFH